MFYIMVDFYMLLKISMNLWRGKEEINIEEVNVFIDYSDVLREEKYLF